MKADWSKENLSKIVKESYSKAEVIKKLGLSVAGGSYSQLNRYLIQYELDTSHFTGARWQKSPNFTEEDKKLNSFYIDIEIGSEKYEIIYWVKRRDVSVHQGTDCMLCGFDKYHSDMAVKIIEEKIKNAFENSSDECKQIATEILI